jgi:hypothetical protein
VLSYAGTVLSMAERRPLVPRVGLAGAEKNRIRRPRRAVGGGVRRARSSSSCRSAIPRRARSSFMRRWSWGYSTSGFGCSLRSAGRALPFRSSAGRTSSSGRRPSSRSSAATAAACWWRSLASASTAGEPCSSGT